MNITTEPNGPGNGDSHSGNGAKNNPIFAELIAAIRVRAAGLGDELRAIALGLSLAAFIEVFGFTKTAWGRKKRAQSTSEGEMSRLRTVARHCPGFNSIAVGSLTPEDIRQMCNLLDNARKSETGEGYKTSSFNTYIGALSRLLETLAAPPLCLIPAAVLPQMLNMIELGDPGVAANCPLPTVEQERVLTEYVQRRCGRGGRLKSLILFLLCLYYGVRRGMVRKIMLEDLSLERNMLRLHFNKQRGGRDITIDVEMPTPLREAFAAWVEYKTPEPGHPPIKRAGSSASVRWKFGAVRRSYHRLLASLLAVDTSE